MSRAAPKASAAGGPLEVRHLSVAFAGLRALDDVSLKVMQGEIVGLIGPNGSGKTTLVNAITGQVGLAGGKVVCGGVDITAKRPAEVARQGVARSFQVVRLFDNLSVRENVEAAAVAQGCGRRAAAARAERLIGALGLEGLAETFAGALSYGDERRVELARALAAEPRFLLLDEPGAGMNDAESEALLAILARLPAERDLGLLIIDHDMGLIMRLCHRLHVLASGRTIAEGDVETVRRDPAVIEAYLGMSADACLGTPADA